MIYFYLYSSISALVLKRPKLNRFCDSRSYTTPTARNWILSRSYCPRMRQLGAQLISVRIRIWPRAAQLGRPAGSTRDVQKAWIDFNEIAVRDRASYRDWSFRLMKGLSNPYHKVGGCASASASEFTGIAVQLENSPPLVPIPPPNLRFHPPFPNTNLTSDVDVWGKVFKTYFFEYIWKVWLKFEIWKTFFLFSVILHTIKQKLKLRMMQLSLRSYAHELGHPQNAIYQWFLALCTAVPPVRYIPQPAITMTCKGRCEL